MPLPATTPKPPYYAVIFTSVRTDSDNSYGDMAEQMLELASRQRGGLDHNSGHLTGRHLGTFCN
jgi:hypothetical protein